MKKVILLVAAILVVGGFVAFRQNGKVKESPPPAGNQSKNQSEELIVYSDAGFSPAVQEVGAGTTVVFKNESSGPLWMASDPHPVHSGLVGFDALKGFSAGQSYSFTFQKAGTWGYHNHLHPSHTGKIVVK